MQNLVPPSIRDTILGTIIARKYNEITELKRRYSLKDWEQWASEKSAPLGFAAALAQKSPAIIAEIKKASPSKGVIRADFDVAAIAQAYQHAGAACLSVLTDVDFFQGHEDNIALAQQACQLPILRKDFMVEPYHIVQSRALGADCILLIVAVLSDAQLLEMSDLALAYGMDVLVEVHDEAELERALRLSSRCLLGVNNRNLKTFEVDIGTTFRLQQLLLQSNDSRQLITESGISTRAQVEQMLQHGIDRFLVGEGFMKQPQPGQALNDLFRVPKSIK